MKYERHDPCATCGQVVIYDSETATTTCGCGTFSCIHLTTQARRQMFTPMREKPHASTA